MDRSDDRKEGSNRECEKPSVILLFQLKADVIPVRPGG
jgi:hypothetical protein